MGYRSSVRIATTPEGYERICIFVDAISQDRSCQLIGKDVKPEYLEATDDGVVFGWDFIKWYELGISSVNDIVHALGDLEGDEIPYEFVRVGESWDDIDYEIHDANFELALHIEPETYISTWR